MVGLPDLADQQLHAPHLIDIEVAAYDACYVALTETLQRDLLTADGSSAGHRTLRLRSPSFPVS